MNIYPLLSRTDIPDEFIHTPVEKLIRYHNFHEPHAACSHPEMLIGKCMDYRVHLRIPPAFAYKLRTGGCNLCSNDFHVAYTVAVGGIKAIALIGHTDCGMVQLEEKREQFIRGFMDHSGQNYEASAAFFDTHAISQSLCKESDILFEEAKRYRTWFPKLPIAVMLYRVEDQLLYLLQEGQ